MRLKILTILSGVLFLAGCGGGPEEIPVPVPSGVTLTIGGGLFRTRVVDADNLAVEQTIDNVTVFFTEPGSNDITHSFVFVGFSTSGDYKIVTIPLDPEELQTRDIYVVANYDREAVLDTVTTVTGLERLRTPAVDKNNNLDPAAGFCMYGFTEAFDFTSGADAVVYVERTCAKLRVTLSFPDDPQWSTDNSVVIAGAASYAFVGDDITDLTLGSDDYFNFAAPIPLEPDGDDNYATVTYVYEASQAPQIYLYVNPSGGEQVFSADLPIPERNYLYDIQIYVYEELALRSGPGQLPRYSLRTEVAVFDETTGLPLPF